MVEIIVAFAILTLTMTAVIIVSFGNETMATDTATSGEALYKASSNLEETRASALLSFGSLVNSTTTDDIYTKEIVVNLLTNYVQQITSRVEWNTDSSRSHKVELSTFAVDIKNANQGDTCDVVLSGDWTRPQVMNVGNALDLGSGNMATDIDVLQGKVYITANSTKTSDKDFFVVDVADPVHPSIVGSLNTGPGLSAVTVVGNYAYVANQSSAISSGQLQIINISNQQSPTLLTTYKLPSVSGTAGVGNSIFYYQSKIYLGTLKATGPEFHIIDVSNPAAPLEIGSWEVNSLVGAIYVSRGVAYLGTPSPSTGADTGQLKILDVSNPTNVVSLGSFTSPVTSTQSGQSMYLLGHTLYFGRSGTTLFTSHKFFTLDISTPSTVVDRGSKDIGSSINDMIVRTGRAFLVTTDALKEFQVWDVHDPQNTTLTTSLDLPASASAMDCEGSTMYVALSSNNALQIIQGSI